MDLVLKIALGAATVLTAFTDGKTEAIITFVLAGLTIGLAPAKLRTQREKSVWDRTADIAILVVIAAASAHIVFRTYGAVI
ncbi:MAG: hypothetical protein ACOX8W_03770 [bacterium]